MAKSVQKKKAKRKAKESETLVIGKDEVPPLRRGISDIPFPKLLAQKPARRSTTA